MIPPKNFCQQLAANVDNKKLTDAQFREFVRNTLPIVGYTELKKPVVEMSYSGGAYDHRYDSYK